MSEPTAETLSNWEGLPGGNEHRTVGPHRAWCHTCASWCYSETTMLCHCCDQMNVPARWRGDNVTKICSIQLHERNPYRQCTCWVQPMLNLLSGQ